MKKNSNRLVLLVAGIMVAVICIVIYAAQVTRPYTRLPVSGNKFYTITVDQIRASL